ncbi:hypothetical protein HPHPH11_0737 [Helicobacter pylori Hp H-11]|uniref:hypothetical protein n=1 Tax=Helicobacter pylori TaxID=210 RepID=UPI00026AEAF5|nr:hypothetical protein [Helicobacter pylori]EJB86495.1 hypothetical protein HPHPH11_0737 [Helicobacter pylori Hp H-11]
METKFFYNEETGRWHSKLTGRPIFGGAEQVCRAKHLNGGLKQTLDQNEELKEVVYYSASLIHEQDKKIQHQDKKIQHLENILGSFLPALNLNIPSLDFNER